MKENKNVLDEVNKGCSMGMDAIKDIVSKVSDKKFEKALDSQYDDYKEIHDRIEEVYKKFSKCDEEPTETNSLNKVMTWSMVEMKTMTDKSDSKLAELLLQGTNMGIVEGRKLLNHKEELDPEVESILKDFIKMQEEEVEMLKKFL